MICKKTAHKLGSSSPPAHHGGARSCFSSRTARLREQAIPRKHAAQEERQERGLPVVGVHDVGPEAEPLVESQRLLVVGPCFHAYPLDAGDARRLFQPRYQHATEPAVAVAGPHRE